MGAILDFIKGIADGVLAGIEFLRSLVEDILYLAQSMANIVSQLPDYLNFFPPQVLTMILSIFVVVVIFRIIGRD